MNYLPAQFLRGIELFNAGEFFECHEAWEEIWLKSDGVEREFLHALIQIAVALLHVQRGNLKGALSVFERARRKLAALPPIVMNLDAQDLAKQSGQFFSAALREEGAIPPFPTIRLRNN
jgi:hypothetical protein